MARIKEVLQRIQDRKTVPGTGTYYHPLSHGIPAMHEEERIYKTLLRRAERIAKRRGVEKPVYAKVSFILMAYDATTHVFSSISPQPQESDMTIITAINTTVRR